MATIDPYPVLLALTKLMLSNNDGSRKVISAAAIAKGAALPLKEVKTILLENDGALSKNDQGKLTGIRVTAYAAEQGLVVLKHVGVKGSRYLARYSFRGKHLCTIDLDERDGYEKANAAEQSFKEQFGVPTCKSVRDLPDDVLKAIWKEQPLDMRHVDTNEQSEASTPTFRR